MSKPLFQTFVVNNPSVLLRWYVPMLRVYIVSGLQNQNDTHTRGEGVVVRTPTSVVVPLCKERERETETETQGVPNQWK